MKWKLEKEELAKRKLRTPKMMSSKTISKDIYRAIHTLKIQILTFCHLPAVRQGCGKQI
jgi:hypothetical protein